jgi:hypothetical protein
MCASVPRSCDPGWRRDTTRPMNVVPRLRHRPTLSSDLAECASALAPRWLDVNAADLQRLWSRLLDEPSAMSTVMEDLAQPSGQRLQGWGCGLVLPPPWVERLGLAQVTPQPGSPVVAQIYAGLLDGSLQPLDDRELGDLNASGQLHFINLHYAQRRSDLADDYALAVLNVANEAFRAAVSGWWLQGMHFESSAHDAPMFASAGFPTIGYVDGVDRCARRCRATASSSHAPTRRAKTSSPTSSARAGAPTTMANVAGKNAARCSPTCASAPRSGDRGRRDREILEAAVTWPRCFAPAAAARARGS